MNCTGKNMTERQKRIAQKLAVQSAKNKLKQLSGIAVSELYGENQNPALDRLAAAYLSSFSDNPKPHSRLPYKSPEETICSWIIDTMELKAQGEYYYHCGLWSKIKLLNLKCAVSSLWRSEKNVAGFLLAETDFSRIMECGLDSRDEDHFLIDIWTPGHNVCL